MELAPDLLEQHMQGALQEAQAASANDEVPVGALIVRDGQTISSAYNRTEELQDPTAHAEILAIRDACKHLGNWRLSDCLLIVTLEPCPMCAGAIFQARIPLVVFGASDERAGAFGSKLDLSVEQFYTTPPRVIGGILKAECAEILQQFFRKKR